jgi:hypothetical protein
MSGDGASIVETALTQATISIPYREAKNFSAMAPAATRPTVSRALERPPPHPAIIRRSLIRIFNHQRDRRAQRYAVIDPRQNSDPVGLFSWGRQFALGRPPPIQLGLDIGFVQGEFWRAAVNHGTDPLTVRLTESGDSK